MSNPLHDLPEPLRFAKYEGLGNDFIVLDSKADVVSTQAAIALCDRHRGVGADGVLFVGDAPSMHVINADGSVPEMCGNGLRCVALHLQRKGVVALNEPFVVQTPAGPHACRVLASGLVEVEMRPASLLPRDIPLRGDAPMVDHPLELQGQRLHVTAVSMGNPHAVVFDPLSAPTRLALGPALHAHPSFVHGANAGFARVVAPAVLELFVYERGAGWTQACGTGACAAAVAAVETGRAERGAVVEVRLPGGSLQITVEDSARPVRMCGPARHVFDGDLAAAH